MAKPKPTAVTRSMARMKKIVESYEKEQGTDTSSAVRDLLTDLRHYCDAKGIDMYVLLDGSYQVYLEEKEEVRNARKV